MDKIQLIDVGARGGIHPRWEQYYSQIEVTAFEPDLEECQRLAAKKYPYRVNFVPVALGEHDKEIANLHVCRQPGCSSVLEPNMNICKDFHYGQNLEVTHKVPVELMRMESVLPGMRPDVLKIDTQGTELAILRGAGALLDFAIAVEIEVEFIEQYFNQPLFADVDLFMRSKGFTLLGIRRVYWRRKAKTRNPAGGQLIHGDALYINMNRVNCAKGHIILSAYRQYDLLAALGAGELIPRQSFLCRLVSLLLSPVANMRWRRLVDALRPAWATDWLDADFY
jgi:FkbM family methyltransferase